VERGGQRVAAVLLAAAAPKPLAARQMVAAPQAAAVVAAVEERSGVAVPPGPSLQPWWRRWRQLRRIHAPGEVEEHKLHRLLLVVERRILHSVGNTGVPPSTRTAS